MQNSRLIKNSKQAVLAVKGWLGRENLSALAVLLIVAAGGWAFVELADEVIEGETRAFDLWMLQLLRNPDGSPLGPAWVTEAIRDITAMGSAAVLSIITLIVAGFCLLIGNRGAMTAVLVAALGGQLLSSLLKQVLQRPRPDVVPHLTEVNTLSFPSGHSMMAATVYLTLGVLLAQFVHRQRLKSYVVSIAIVLTVLVGFSRVYLGVHYPTDVLAGWTAGGAWALACGLVVGYFRLKTIRPPAGEPTSYTGSPPLQSQASTKSDSTQQGASNG